ncbi:MAG: hypothetical protein QOJ55_54 [Solirubrobacteraceae bacterium]|nr:hypothetical protein [Solirubrobacteraceae bacterium]
MLWIAGVNLVWAAIFVGVLVFALRTDTEAAHRSHRGPGADPGPDPPRPPDPHGVGRRARRRERRRRRGADRAAAHPRAGRGSRSEPRPLSR